MFGRSPKSFSFSSPNVFDPLLYPSHLQAKLAELVDFAESNLTAACNQKRSYGHHTAPLSFAVGNLVWLSVHTAGKLDPWWEGEWVIKSVRSPVNIEITNKRKIKVVDTNLL